MTKSLFSKNQNIKNSDNQSFMNKLTDVPRSNISNSHNYIKIPSKNLRYYEEKTSIINKILKTES